MFIRPRTIRLADTDATGVLYFAAQFRIVQEVFEQYLDSLGFCLGMLLEKTDFFIPVVHAESEYLAPLYVGDSVEIRLRVFHIGSSSFGLEFSLWDPKREKEVGLVRITHVAVAKSSRKSIPIPPELLAVLNKLLLLA